MQQTRAQIILIISALLLLVEPLGDGWLGLGMLSENHVGSSIWPDHAKYHVVRQAFSTIFVSLLTIWGILKFWNNGRGVRIAFALIPLFLNVSAILAVALASLWSIENPVAQPGIGGPAIVLSIFLTGAGLFLESREHKTQ